MERPQRAWRETLGGTMGLVAFAAGLLALSRAYPALAVYLAAVSIPPWIAWRTRGASSSAPGELFTEGQVLAWLAGLALVVSIMSPGAEHCTALTPTGAPRRANTPRVTSGSEATPAWPGLPPESPPDSR